MIRLCILDWVPRKSQRAEGIPAEPSTLKLHVLLSRSLPMLPQGPLDLIWGAVTGGRVSPGLGVNVPHSVGLNTATRIEE